MAMKVLPRTLIEPAAEPVTLGQLRGQVRADDSVDDGMLLGYLIAARATIEQRMNRPIMPRTVTAVFESWPDGATTRLISRLTTVYDAGTIDIAMPVSSVDAITYTDAAGDTQPWTDFVARTDQGGVTRVRPAYGTSWPVLGNDPVITLTATAGFDAVPEPIVQAVLKLAAWFYANRDGLGDQTMGFGEIPADIRQMVAPWRWIWMG